MRWYRNLYMGPNAALYVEKVRRRAAQGKMMPGIYYLTLPTVPGKLLDIFHNGFLKQELFAEHQRQDVIGIAEGKQEAFRLTDYGRSAPEDRRVRCGSFFPGRRFSIE